MTDLNASARSADSASMKGEHRFPWRWYLSDLDRVQKHGHKVFSCFSCGGGSSMGYKLAGYDVIGCCEIDERVLNVYRKNLHPAHPYHMDVRDFDACGFSDEDFRNIQSFPQDYDFGDQSAQYICGMSVPPVMMAQIATEVYQQWLR